MREALVVAKRDFLERVRSKLFIVMTIVWPMFMIGMIVVPALLESRSVGGARIDVVDRSGAVGPAVVQMLETPALKWHATLAASDATEEQENARIRGKQINGYLVIPKEILTSGEPVYYGENASSQLVQVLLQRFVPQAIQKVRAQRAGLTDEQIKTVLADIRVRPQHTTGAGTAMSGLESCAGGIVLMLLASSPLVHA